MPAKGQAGDPGIGITCKGPEEGRSTELRRTRTAEGAAETGEMGRGQVPESFLEQMAESRF